MRLFIYTVAVMLCCSGAYSQVSVLDASPRIDESAIPPNGITFQMGPGSGNEGNWTYNYGTKLSVFGGDYRNFELMNTAKESKATLAFRTYDPGPAAWTPWKELIYRDADGHYKFPVRDAFAPQQDNHDGDLLLQSSGIEAKDNYGAAFSFSRMSGGNKRASIVAKQTHSDPDNIGLAFFTHGNTGANDLAERMVITGYGNVGIGIPEPQSKLAVGGQIRATEVKVLADITVPDYVFEDNYDLRSIAETERYIEKHKHLPEIPSAADIKADGIDLGDMNMRLLKKIEELTLYVIELKKENEEQNLRIQDLIEKQK